MLTSLGLAQYMDLSEYSLAEGQLSLASHIIKMKKRVANACHRGVVRDIHIVKEVLDLSHWYRGSYPQTIEVHAADVYEVLVAGLYQ